MFAYGAGMSNFLCSEEVEAAATTQPCSLEPLGRVAAGDVEGLGGSRSANLKHDRRPPPALHGDRRARPKQLAAVQVPRVVHRARWGYGSRGTGRALIVSEVTRVTPTVDIVRLRAGPVLEPRQSRTKLLVETSASRWRNTRAAGVHGGHSPSGTTRPRWPLSLAAARRRHRARRRASTQHSGTPTTTTKAGAQTRSSASSMFISLTPRPRPR